MTDTVKVSGVEYTVLRVLCDQHEDFGCLDFATISSDTRLERAQVRRICRSLKRKGLAEFHSGLWSEDGEPRGSGYCASSAGRTALAGEKE